MTREGTPHLEQDPNRSWVYVKQRDLDEGTKLSAEIDALGLPEKVVDTHVPCYRFFRIVSVNLRKGFSKILEVFLSL